MRRQSGLGLWLGDPAELVIGVANCCSRSFSRLELSEASSETKRTTLVRSIDGSRTKLGVESDSLELILEANDVWLWMACSRAG
jgi:hypothetical protein